jgi:hypothetical protein
MFRERRECVSEAFGVKNLLRVMLIVTDRTPDALDTIEGSTKETQESCKEPEPDLAGVGAITGKSKGFRMSAAFDVCSFAFSSSNTLKVKRDRYIGEVFFCVVSELSVHCLQQGKSCLLKCCCFRSPIGSSDIVEVCSLLQMLRFHRPDGTCNCK